VPYSHLVSHLKINQSNSERISRKVGKTVKKILVVDDDIDITLLIKEGLERKGFHIESYNDPQVALQEFKPDFYDLMLVDIRMPKVNGFEFYQGVRKNDIKVKVCFITAFAISYEEISKILPPELVTRQNIIHKPIGIKELINKINEILR
jgi:two-component system, OmpR family, response regulator ChvI